MSVPKSGWKFEYDYTPEHGSEGWILGPRNELIVEEPGPEATWEHLEHIVKCVNAHPELTARIEELGREAKILRKKVEAVERLPFCPDHRDKVARKPCRECRIESLERVNAELLEAARGVRDNDPCSDGDCCDLAIANDRARERLATAIASAEALTGETK